MPSKFNTSVTDDGADAETSLFLSLCFSISLLRLFSRSHLVNIFSLKMRVSSKELFSTLKNLEVCLRAVFYQQERRKNC